MSLRDNYDAWQTERSAYATNDGTSVGPTASEWQDSDDTAVDLLHEAMKLVVEPHEGGNSDTNSDRAAMIRPFVLAYRRAYYFHFGDDGEPDEPLETVIADMIGNLMHMADREDPDDMIESGGEGALDRGRTFYYEEIAEENADAP